MGDPLGNSKGGFVPSDPDFPQRGLLFYFCGSCAQAVQLLEEDHGILSRVYKSDGPGNVCQSFHPDHSLFCAV